jgi:hypothetical protein
MGCPTTRENPKRPLEQPAPIGALVHARDDIRPCVPVAFEKRDQRRRCALVLHAIDRHRQEVELAPKIVQVHRGSFPAFSVAAVQNIACLTGEGDPIRLTIQPEQLFE